MISRLIRLTVETGTVTATSAAVELILFEVFQSTNLHFTMYVPLPQLTMNQLRVAHLVLFIVLSCYVRVSVLQIISSCNRLIFPSLLKCAHDGLEFSIWHIAPRFRTY